MRAISSMATRHVLADLAEAAAAAGLPLLQLESVGGVDAAQRVTAGEPFDLVFLAEDALQRLAGERHVDPASIAPIVLSEVAVGVPAPSADAAACSAGTAFANADELRSALRAAFRIGYSTGPSGTELLRMIDHWGMTDEVSDRLVQAGPGVPVASLLAAGEVDLGLQQLSELVGQPGVCILGVLPADCAISTVFAGAVATSSNNAARAADILAFFRSDLAASIKSLHSFRAP
ncbi:substrate-binding domain-containing protein [Pseudarthrobacter oxydans]|jgi:molybdate transport system substrate-binding protein|uniref:Putative ABC transport system, periplasmic component n=4 Tax=unclassified Arthrobacter TaxID=235627 RepID=I3W1B7_9MICC|nr:MULTISPECIES: substrate-binding domain-containing protein [unclassified Arthrobacter]AFK89189.1 putative ABC transport system, periplasmic component [Arthrobacter sp. J3.37]AFK89394.1 putative ABC transport system, periplasmic component [Arthrobacter sp. J3.40]AFK89456.1 putative ABC transport system, periplasmic component [Arthrobacter sp. J3.49]AFK89646.1 putative ABC transport system, periplasmic component [Arthrobacter sp. J3.53]